MEDLGWGQAVCALKPVRCTIYSSQSWGRDKEGLRLGSSCSHSPAHLACSCFCISFLFSGDMSMGFSAESLGGGGGGQFSSATHESLPVRSGGQNRSIID